MCESEASPSTSLPSFTHSPVSPCPLCTSCQLRPKKRRRAPRQPPDEEHLASAPPPPPKEDARTHARGGDTSVPSSSSSSTSTSSSYASSSSSPSIHARTVYSATCFARAAHVEQSRLSPLRTSSLSFILFSPRLSSSPHRLSSFLRFSRRSSPVIHNQRTAPPATR